MVNENQNLKDDYKEDGIVSLAKARQHFWYLHRNNIIEALMGEFHNRAINILELGAGSGNISLYLKKKGYSVVASEYYESGVDIIKKNGIKAFQYDLVNNSHVPKEHIGAYDIVVLGDVIEHLDDPVQALKTAGNFLHKGGGILITVPALSFLWTNYDIHCRHKRRYSCQMLNQQLRKAGYKIIKVKYFMFVSGILLLITRIIKGRLLRQDSDSYSNEMHISTMINTIMNAFMTVEYWLQKFVYLPFGSSIYGLALLENNKDV